MKVFISGSISIKKLPRFAIEKIESLIEKKYTILIGDAKGVDSVVQKYLLKRKYDNIVVYHAGNVVRNNLGNWPIQTIQNRNNEKGRALYTLKDLEMANDSDYGLMIWDGSSEGTLANIEAMKARNKRFFVVLEELIVDERHIDQILQIKNGAKKEVAQAELF